jgi:hypothetical protein
MREEQAELEAQIKALLERALAADRAERDEPELDVPAEIERLEARQTELDKEKGRDPEDDRRPKDKDGKPKGGRYKRDFGVPEDTAQESFTDPDSRIMKRAGGGFDQSYAPKEVPLGTTPTRRSMTRPRSSWPPNCPTTPPMPAACRC